LGRRVTRRIRTAGIEGFAASDLKSPRRHRRVIEEERAFVGARRQAIVERFIIAALG